MPRKTDRAVATPAAGHVGERSVGPPDERSFAADGRPDINSEPGETDQRLVRSVHILSSLLAEILEHRYLEDTCAYPINRAQLCLLRLITRVPELQVSEVAGHLGFSAAAASKNIDKLEQYGLLLRDQDPDDRRAKRLRPTLAGRRLVGEHEQLETEHLAPVLLRIRPGRVDLLCQLLTEVCIGLAAQLPARYGTCLRCAGHIAGGCPLGRLQGGCSLLEAQSLVGTGPGGTA